MRLLVSVPSLKFEVNVSGEDPELVVHAALHALLLFLEKIKEAKKVDESEAEE